MLELQQQRMAQATDSDKAVLAAMEKVRGYVNETVVPLVRSSIVPVEEMRAAKGAGVTAQYLDAVKDLGGLLSAAPEIFLATASGRRGGEHGFDAEVQRVTDRIRPFLEGRFPAQLQDLERVEQALTLDEVGGSLV